MVISRTCQTSATWAGTQVASPFGNVSGHIVILVLRPVGQGTRAVVWRGLELWFDCLEYGQWLTGTASAVRTTGTRPSSVVGTPPMRGFVWFPLNVCRIEEISKFLLLNGEGNCGSQDMLTKVSTIIWKRGIRRSAVIRRRQFDRELWKGHWIGDSGSMFQALLVKWLVHQVPDDFPHWYDGCHTAQDRFNGLVDHWFRQHETG